MNYTRTSSSNNIAIQLDNGEMFICKSIYDDNTRIMITEFLCNRVLYLSNFPSIAGHTASVRCTALCSALNFFTHIVSNELATIGSCESCIFIGNRHHRRQNLNFFPAAGPLKFVSINILGLYLNSRRESACIGNHRSAFQVNARPC